MSKLEVSKEKIDLLMHFRGFDLVLWDLDNTIYFENEFLFQAYEKFASNFVEKEDIYKFLKTEFLLNGRKSLLDKVIKEFSLKESDKSIFFDSLREYIYVLNPKESIIKLMKLLNEKLISQGVITNGNPIQQRHKVKGLNLVERCPFLSIIYANEYEAKPSPRAYYEFLKMIDLEIEKSRVLYIGDSDIDKEFAKNVGIHFLHIDKISIGYENDR